MIASDTPLVSVIVEGYNEVQLATSIGDSIAGLLEQDYPLDRIELLLIGSADEQSGRWGGYAASELPFHRVVAVEAGGLPYYALKNRGAQLASGEVLAFTDSDVRAEPTWVSAIVDAIRAGADATSGVTRLWSRARPTTPDVVLTVAGSICFGHPIPEDPCRRPADARALVAHNLGVRAAAFRVHPFDTREFGRNCGPVQLYEDLRNDGLRIHFAPDQRAQHSFKLFRWFFYPFHVRVGYEEHVARRVAPTAHRRWLMKTGPAEPLITMLFTVAYDVQTWTRYSRALPLCRRERWLFLPALVALSVPARLAGMMGGYAGMLAPRRMKAWAEAQ